MTLPEGTIDLGPTELDKLVWIAINCELNDWENGFCLSTIKWLKDGNGKHLSPKQLVCLNRMLAKFEVEAGEITTGFADEATVTEAIAECTQYEANKRIKAENARATNTAYRPPAPRPASGWDDMDDDIPF